MVDQMGNGVKRAEKEMASGEWREGGKKTRSGAYWLNPELLTLTRTHGLHLPVDLRNFSRPPGHFQIVKILEVQPELRVGLEVPREPQRRLCRDAAPFVYDFPNPRGRHVQLQGQLVHAQPQRLHEVLPQDFPRVNRRHQLS